MDAAPGAPTVRQVWRLALPSGTALLAGEGGLARPVAWTCRMAVHPPAFANLEAGELALLVVEDLKFLDERLTLARVTGALVERGAVALAVLGPAPEAARRRAAGAGLPLLQLPAGADLREVERDVIRLIVEREAQLERRGQEIRRRLTQLSIENRGLAAVAQALTEITGKPTVIQDEHLTIQVAAWPEGVPPASEALTEALQDAGALREHLWRAPATPPAAMTPAEYALAAPPWTRRVAAIRVEGTVRGYLSLLKPAGGLDALDALALEQGATVCAIEVAKQRAVTAAEDRLRGDLLGAILTAGPGEERALIRRAREMGYDLTGQHVALIFSPEDRGEASGPLGRLASAFQAQLLNTGIETFICAYEGDLVVLCGARESESLRPLEELARQAVHRVDDEAAPGGVTVGLGRAERGLAGLRRSFTQAREARTMARHLFGGGRVLPFSDLGIYRLLCRLEGSEELSAFHEQTLAPLVRYDAGHGTALVPTLEAFFAHHGNVSQTAESLHLHRNSLLYRLERIGEITGLDLNDPDDRFALQLALKIYPLLDDGHRP
jgi:purine catabolism regulator